MSGVLAENLSAQKLLQFFSGFCPFQSACVTELGQGSYSKIIIAYLLPLNTHFGIFVKRFVGSFGFKTSI